MFLALKSIELSGFKSFGKKSELVFQSPIASIVGPNGSGKSNVAEAFRFVLGEQSMKSMRSRKGEDLIWGGSPALPRMNRGAVRVTFDNSKRLLDIDFKEVVVERVVYRDGQNEYLLNGTQVRLKDVIRLLAGANIGGSGYQIISQGEADRILNASPKERREMVEDALGLKLYQHKKIESERKLEETGVNIEKTRSLAPGDRAAPQFPPSAGGANRKSAGAQGRSLAQAQRLPRARARVDHAGGCAAFGRCARA